MIAPKTGKRRSIATFLSRYSINTKIIVAITFLAGITWPILDYYQGQNLNKIFEQQLNSVLQHQAREARSLFDKYIRSFHSTNKIIISQQNLSGYLHKMKNQWSNNEPITIKTYRHPAPWLPKTSVMRTLARAEYYLIYDRFGKLREVYTYSAALPAELLNSAALFRQLSHNQALMTEISGVPFIIASSNYYEDDKNALGSLTIAAPLDNAFLTAAIEDLLPNKIVALIDNQTQTVIASNRPDLIQAGSSQDEIKKKFLLTGKSFFDYGASNLQAHFISLIAKNEYDTLSEQIHAIGRRQRAIISLVMALPLLAALFWIAHRLTRLASLMTDFSESHLSGKQNITPTRDQLLVLEERFVRLTDEIILTNIESENKYRILIEATATGFVIVDATGNVLDANQEYLRMTGAENFDQIMGRNVQEWTAPYDRERNLKEVKKCFEKGYVTNLEIDYIDKNNNVTPVEINARLGEHEGKPIILAIMRDISERRHAAEKLQQSLTEKEALLKEIHHRVKNNMQIISSLLSLQAEKVKNPEAMAIIKDSRDRVKSMGLIHEKLYHKGNLAQIDFGDYIHSLCKEIARSYQNPDLRIRFDINAANFFLPIDIAIPCGLLISELITNSIKHAFSETREGTIGIFFQNHPDNTVTLGVKDNGKGFPADLDVTTSDTLGLNVIKNLTRQLGATIKLGTEDGTAYEFNFSLNQ